MKKIIFILLLISTIVYAKKPIYNVLISETVPSGYDSKLYKKAVVLLTDARLYLQKKYKRTIEFKQTSLRVTSKSQQKQLLSKEGARYYVYVTIKEKKKRGRLTDVYYNLVIYDGKKNKTKTVKTKATIKDKEVVKIAKGDMKSTKKKLAKFFKQK